MNQQDPDLVAARELRRKQQARILTQQRVLGNDQLQREIVREEFEDKLTERGQGRFSAIVPDFFKRLMFNIESALGASGQTLREGHVDSSVGKAAADLSEATKNLKGLAKRNAHTE